MAVTKEREGWVCRNTSAASEDGWLSLDLACVSIWALSAHVTAALEVFIVGLASTRVPEEQYALKFEVPKPEEQNAQQDEKKRNSSTGRNCSSSTSG